MKNNYNLSQKKIRRAPLQKYIMSVFSDVAQTPEHKEKRYPTSIKQQGNL